MPKKKDNEPNPEDHPDFEPMHGGIIRGWNNFERSKQNFAEELRDMGVHVADPNDPR
ncbi:hypothetical protein [Actinokineospora globicatena]|uniref:Uncharacterized protein n=1 Tax=Actinokineospora globicatena TaxID=103729 RepID=A0A9W6V6P4_9PSEU|nr:hypothetical protein [Actinokineospora globicatena]GLW91805.1 hypothetical protein Aglo03_26210 [Actinokineospora globicatena]